MLHEENWIATCSYNLYKKKMGKPIRTSVSEPAWFLKAHMQGEFLTLIKEVAPFGIFDAEKNYDSDEIDKDYEERYIERLEQNKNKIFEQLNNLYNGETLILLCFCDISKIWCHRTLLANWLAENGLHSEELGISKKAKTFNNNTSLF